MSLDNHFIERVRECLGDGGTPELTASGRTLVRFPDFVVAPEGASGAPIAARIVDRSAQFARVRRDGQLEWLPRRPECARGLPRHVKTKKRRGVRGGQRQAQAA